MEWGSHYVVDMFCLMDTVHHVQRNSQSAIVPSHALQQTQLCPVNRGVLRQLNVISFVMCLQAPIIRGILDLFNALLFA